MHAALGQAVRFPEATLIELTLRREDGLPVIFHIDDNPAFGVGFVESFVEAADG